MRSQALQVNADLDLARVELQASAQEFAKASQRHYNALAETYRLIASAQRQYAALGNAKAARTAENDYRAA